MILVCLLSAALAADPVSLPEAPPAGYTPSPADDARARELYENGAMLYDEGRYEDAVAAWTEAYRLSGRPLLLFNMANASERLGRYAEAMALLSRYRAYAPSEEREILDRRIRNIEARLDDEPAAAPPTTAPAPATAATSEPEEERRRIRVLPIVLGGVGVVGLGAGTGFGVAALGARDQAALGCVTIDGVTTCDDSASAALTADKRSSLAADLSMGIGVLGVAGAVVTAVLPVSTGGLSGWIGPGSGGLSLRGAF